MTYIIGTRDGSKSLESYPFYVRQHIVVSMINNLSFRQTDCGHTFDYIMDSLSKCVKQIRNISDKEMFELLIRLNKNGVKNMRDHLFREWKHPNVNIWDYRNIVKTKKFLENKYLG